MENNNKITTDDVLYWLAGTSHGEEAILELGAQRNLLEGQMIAKGRGSKGTITLKIDIELVDDDPALFAYTPEINIKLPKSRTPGAMMYKGEDGHHSKDNPRQMRMSFEPEEKSTTRIILEEDENTNIHPEDN